MKLHKLSIVLLALLLAAMAMVPIVSAEDQDLPALASQEYLQNTPFSFEGKTTIVAPGIDASHNNAAAISGVKFNIASLI